MLKYFVSAMLCLFGASANAARSIDYFLWPATEFKSTLDTHSACELLIERDVTPRKLDRLVLNVLKKTSTISIRVAVEAGLKEGQTPPVPLEFLKSLALDLTRAQETYGFDHFQEFGLVTAKEDIQTLIAYDSFIPTRDALARLEQSLRDRLDQTPWSASDEEVKWDLSILQGLTSLYNLAHPNEKIPLEVGNHLVADFLRRN